MPPSSLLAALRRSVSLRERRRQGRRGEDGFILLESVVAISLITIVMGALATFTLNAVTATTEMRARQGAVQVATSTMATIGSLPATDLVAGRGFTPANQQFTNAPPTVRPQLAAMDPAFDAANPLPPAKLPFTLVPQTLNGVTYSTSVYLGRCELRSATTAPGSTDCILPSTGTGTAQLRVVLAVSWSNRACRGGSCLYTSASLVNDAVDPVFNSNRANPPTPPVVADPGNQVSTIGVAETLQLAVQPGTGLEEHSWAVTTGTLPAGLNLSSRGLVSGTPTVLGGPTSITVTVTDAFGRKADGTFTWRVVARPTITTPGAQTSTRGEADTLAMSATCLNTPCTWTMAGAPAGLTINTATGAISGTPTTAGVSSVTVTVTDADGAAATTGAFTWTVSDPSAIGAVGNILTTVGVNTNVELPYSCVVGPCTIALTNPVPGLGLSTTSGRSGTNNTTTLTVPTGTGRVHVSGTVTAAAVPSGSARAIYTVTARITDNAAVSRTSSGTWTATTNTLVNYALRRTTTQSSTSQGAGPERAVDGNTDGTYANGSVSHTNDSNQPWWQVDLGAATTIRTVQLFNRTDCCTDRLARGIVFLSNTDMTGRTYAELDADAAVLELPFISLDNASLALSANDVRARYVRVQLSGSNPLHMAEVQVLGPNLAAGRTATQSGTDFNGDPSRAVDGNTDGVYNNGSVTHTTNAQQSWWQVDLGASATVNAVTVWNRTDCCTDRLNGAVLLLSDTDMAGRSYTTLNNDATVTKIAFGSTAARSIITAGRTARYVRVQLPQTGNAYLSLAEVQVNGTIP